STTVAGSGRHLTPPRTRLYKVTTLAPDGPGSLTACVRGTKPRVCAFEVSGVIRLDDPLVVRSPYLTIAGQTAPPPGIRIRGAGVRVESHDVLLQHLEIRVGDAPEGPNPVSRDGISIGHGRRPVYNVVIDHASISWAIDENLTVFGTAHDVTVSSSIISEALH